MAADLECRSWWSAAGGACSLTTRDAWGWPRGLTRQPDKQKNARLPCVENINRTGGCDRIYGRYPRNDSSVGSPAMRPCWTSTTCTWRRRAVSAIQRLGKNLAYVHFLDAAGESFPQVPGKGEIPLDSILAALGRQVTMAVMHRDLGDDPIEIGKQSIQYYRSLSGSPGLRREWGHNEGTGRKECHCNRIVSGYWCRHCSSPGSPWG